MVKRKRPDSIGKNSGEKEKAFVGISRKEKENLLTNLKGEDGLRQKIATPLIDQGVDTSVNASWPEVLETLHHHLMEQFNINRSFFEKKGIKIPKSGSNIQESLSPCTHLIKTLEFMARSGELWSWNMISPIRMFVELAYYWRNRLLRFFENKTSEKSYKYVCEDHRKEAHACFREMIGLPFETINELNNQICPISTLTEE